MAKEKQSISSAEVGTISPAKKFAIRISGELEADSLEAAYAKIATYFAALEAGKEVPPLTDGICRVTPVDNGG